MGHDRFDTFDPTLSGSHAWSAQVPQEHTSLPGQDSPPSDWSQLGRQVLAEAWRRTTEESASRRPQATPAVSAPSRVEGA